MRFNRGIRSAWLRGTAGGTKGAAVFPAVGALVALLGLSQAAQADEVAAADGAKIATTEAAPIHQPFEIGIFLGGLFPPNRHALRDPFLPDDPATRGVETNALDDVAPEFGIRIAVLPIPYLGVEGEATIMPTSAALFDASGAVRDTSSATLYALRGHLLLQYPFASVTPFILGGVGRHYLNENSGIIGKDSDVSFHFGGGVKLPLKEHLQVRIDVRDTIIPQQGFVGAKDPTSHWPEALVGLTYAFGGSEPPPPPPPPPMDSDHDGLTDDLDKCPVAPANTPDGCPIPDTDGDGVVDNVDECPTQVGTLPNGCPDLDTDKDSIPVPADVCPDQPGIAPDGCPDKDSDKDGVPVPDDKCVDQPETKNGYEDADGCPDEVPEVVKKFTGVIKGINFEFGKATIRRDSFPLLDEAAKVLVEFPSLRLEISGHTDNVGTVERNLELSKARAESVRAYIMTKGVASERLEARGVGSAEPVADNKTKAGQAQNRRIEFKILQ